MHEGQFLNVGSLAKQNFGILSSQIKTKWAFSIARLLIALRHCHLQMDNMDWIITIVKNWPYDPLANYKPIFDFKQYLKTWVEDNYDLIEEHEFFEELQVDGD